MLNCSAHEVGGVLVITLEESAMPGDDRQSSHRQALYKSIQTRDDLRYAVDLGKLEYMSSADFGFLISMRQRIDARGGKLVLFDVDPFIMRTLESMKILPLFPIADDLTEALILLPPDGA